MSEDITDIRVTPLDANGQPMTDRTVHMETLRSPLGTGYLAPVPQ